MQNQSLNNCCNIPSQNPNAVSINIFSPTAYGNNQGNLNSNPNQNYPNNFYSVYGTNTMPDMPLYPSNYNNFINYPNAIANPIAGNSAGYGAQTPVQYVNPALLNQGYNYQNSNQGQYSPNLYPQNGLNPSQMPYNQAGYSPNNLNQYPSQFGYTEQGAYPGQGQPDGNNYPMTNSINNQAGLYQPNQLSGQNMNKEADKNNSINSSNALNNSNFLEKTEKVQTPANENKTEDKKEEKTIIPLTDEYVKNLENYLNSDNSKIRLIGAKELMQRFKEDDSRKDHKSLVPLLNKALKDKSPSVRFLALTMLQLGYSVGNDETVLLLNKIANENQDKFGQDSLLASEILLKLSAPQAVKTEKGGKS